MFRLQIGSLLLAINAESKLGLAQGAEDEAHDRNATIVSDVERL